MELIIIFFVTLIASALFIIASKMRNDYRQKKLIESYANLVVKLKEDMNHLEGDNIYSLEEYRVKKLRKNAEAYAMQCELVWSEEIGEYIKVPKDENDL